MDNGTERSARSVRLLGSPLTHDAWCDTLMSYHSGIGESDVGQMGTETPLLPFDKHFFGRDLGPRTGGGCGSTNPTYGRGVRLRMGTEQDA